LTNHSKIVRNLALSGGFPQPIRGFPTIAEWDFHNWLRKAAGTKFWTFDLKRSI